jgi:hypothetical protein
MAPQLDQRELAIEGRWWQDEHGFWNGEIEALNVSIWGVTELDSILGIYYAVESVLEDEYPLTLTMRAGEGMRFILIGPENSLSSLILKRSQEERPRTGNGFYVKKLWGTPNPELGSILCSNVLPRRKKEQRQDH